jgi:hypothetical protein
VNEAAVKQKLLDEGFDPKNATEQQKVMARLAIIMAGTTAAQGDAVRTSDSFANQTKRLKGLLADLAVQIGSALIPPLTKVVQFFANYVKLAIEWGKTNAGLIKTIAAVAVGVAAFGAALVVVGGAISAIGSVVGVVVSAFTAIGTALGIAGALLGALLSPLGLVIAGIAALGVAAVKYFGGFGAVVEWITGKVGDMGEVFGQAIEVIKTALASGDITTAAQVFWAGLQLVWAKGVQSLSTIWSKAKQLIIGTWIEVNTTLANAWAITVSFIQRSWIKSTTSIKDFAQALVTAIVNDHLLLAQGILGILEGIAEAWDAVFGTEFGRNIDAAITKLQRLREESTQAVLADVSKRDKEERKRLTEIDQRRSRTLEQLEAERQRRHQELAQVTGEDIQQAQNRLDEAFAAYSKTVENAATKQQFDALANLKPKPKLDEAAEAIDRGTVKPDRNVGTIFGGERAAQIFGDGQDAQLTELKGIRQILRDSLTEQKKKPTGIVITS